MNNSATTRRITKIALEYNSNDKEQAKFVFSNNLLSEDPAEQFKEMKTIADRNSRVKNWALTGYISPEKTIGDQMSDEELTDLALKALEKVGVTKDNQMRLDVHNSTKQKHIHFIVNRVNTIGKNAIKAHMIGERFGNAVREICKIRNLRTDIEIGIDKKTKMLESLQESLTAATSFDELLHSMAEKGYRVTLSQNVKIGVSGMRIVKFEDINESTEKDYRPGFKLSELSNKLKIVEIKRILAENKIKASLKKVGRDRANRAKDSTQRTKGNSRITSTSGKNETSKKDISVISSQKLPYKYHIDYNKLKR